MNAVLGLQIQKYCTILVLSSL